MVDGEPMAEKSVVRGLDRDLTRDAVEAGTLYRNPARPAIEDRLGLPLSRNIPFRSHSGFPGERCASALVGATNMVSGIVVVSWCCGPQ
jgi:hypothetical protein